MCNQRGGIPGFCAHLGGSDCSSYNNSPPRNCINSILYRVHRRDSHVPSFSPPNLEKVCPVETLVFRPRTSKRYRAKK